MVNETNNATLKSVRGDDESEEVDALLRTHFTGRSSGTANARRGVRCGLAFGDGPGMSWLFMLPAGQLTLTGGSRRVILYEVDHDRLLRTHAGSIGFLIIGQGPSRGASAGTLTGGRGRSG